MVTNRWKPDTCGCVIEFEFDADAPDHARVHVAKPGGKKCQAHASATDHHAHYDGVLIENRKKNVARQAIVDALPASEVIEDTDFDGNVSRRPKFEPRFEFDANRKLKFVVNGSAKSHLAKLNAEVKKLHPDVDVE